MLARVDDPVAQREGGADPAGAAQRGQAAPAQPQAEDVGEALAGVQPQVQPDPQVAGAVAGQVAGGQERPRGERRHDEHDGQGDGVLDHHRGSPFRAARTALRRAVRAAPVFRSSWGARSALIPATRCSGMEARGPCRSVTRSRNRAVLVAFPGCGAGAGRSAGARRPGATGHSCEHPGAEPGQGGGGGQGQAQQPQDQAAEDGQRGGRVGGQGGAEVVVAGEGPGADDADEGVAGQGVGDGGQGPDGQVPPAGFGRDGVHEHAGGDRGQVQRPGAERAAAVQGQRDAEAGEDQGGGVGDRGFQGGDGGEVAGGFGHPVLGGEAHRGGGRGQDAQAGGGVAQPQARPVRGGPEAGGVPVPGVVARAVRSGRGGRRVPGRGRRSFGGARRPAPVVASRARGPGTMAGQRRRHSAGWRDLRDERISVSCSEDAPEGQDAVTTRQDGGWICQDVPARV